MLAWFAGCFRTAAHLTQYLCVHQNAVSGVSLTLFLMLTLGMKMVNINPYLLYNVNLWLHLRSIVKIFLSC